MSLRRRMKRRLVIILAINLISNWDKLSIQFQKLGKNYSKRIRMIAQI